MKKTMNQDKKEAITESLRDRKGDEWIEEHRELLIDQARVVGIDITDEVDAICQGGDREDTPKGSIDFTGPVDRNWLREDPPEPDYVTATEEEIAEQWEEYRQRKDSMSR